MQIIKEFLLAFFFGGILCVIGQLLIDYTSVTPARILVSYVTVGVIVGGLGLYKPLVDIFGCGATVPLTGFGNLLAKGVKETIEKDGFIGILSGGLIGAAAGIGAAVFFGFVTALAARPKSK